MKHIKSLLMLVGLIGCALLPGPSFARGRLECNIGVADITPVQPVVLAGFAARKGLSDGVHRPLKTHCLVIRKDTVRVCIITNDMMEIGIDLADELRQTIAQKTGIPRSHVFIHNTHTHSAPRTGGASVEAGGSNAGYKQQFAETLVANAVRTAADTKAFRSFTLEVGCGMCDINCNRGEKGGPADHSLYAVRLLDRKGRPIVAMLNYACHPVSLGYRSLVVSPDFPGIACEALDAAWGCPTFYFNGPAGNVNPCGKLGADTAYTQSLGLRLADAAQEIRFRRLKGRNTLAVRVREIQLPYRIPEITSRAIEEHVVELKKQTGVSGTWLRDVEGWREFILGRIAAQEVKNYLPFEIAGVDVGGLLILFSQGEPFNEYQTSLRETMPGSTILSVAYTNGQNSYLPGRRAYERKNYVYEKEQMHVYIKAPYPLSEKMPDVYEAAIKEILNNIKPQNR